jgi:hypothetical protein
MISSTTEFTSKILVAIIAMGLLGVLSQGIKRPGSEAHNSPPSGAEVKDDGTIPNCPICLHGVVLK